MSRWLVLFALALPSVAHAQDSLRIAERVGTVLDANERAYFGLFPRVSAFERAAFFAEGDSVRMEVKREALPDTVLRIPAATAAMLGRYVDTFETEGERMLLENAPILIRLVRYPHTYSRPQAVRFRLTTGQRIEGHVLRAEEDRVLLLPSGQSQYDWRRADQTRTVSAASIRSFQTPALSTRPLVVGTGAGVIAGLATYALADDNGLGLAFGAATTVIAAVSSLVEARTALVQGNATRYRFYRPSLREAEAFSTDLPPEPLPNDHGSASMSSRAPSVASWILGKPDRYLHVLITAPRTTFATRSLPTSTIRYLDPTGRYQTSESRGTGLESQLLFSASLTPLRSVGVGGEWARFRTSPEGSTTVRSYNGQESYGFVEATLRPPATVPLLNRLSVSAAYGIGRASYKTQTLSPIDPAWYFYTLQPVPLITETLETSHEMPAKLLRVGVDVWISPFTSLRAEYTQKTVDGTVDIPGYSYTYNSQGNQGLLTSATATSVDLSHRDVSVGVRLHF